MSSTDPTTLAAPAAARARVLVIEDSPEFRLMVATVLENAGHEVVLASDGSKGLELAGSTNPSVIVLDLGLPDIDGLEVCQKLRSFTDAYVLMLSGRDGQEDKYEGLTVGADEYLTKPFEAKELLLRIEVLLRRPRSSASQPEPGSTGVSFGDVRIEEDARRVWVGDREVNLTKIEFAMLQALADEVGAARSRAAIATAVWGPHWVGDDHVINVHMANLRKKLDVDSVKRIVTVRGIGYRLEPAVAAAA